MSVLKYLPIVGVFMFNTGCYPGLSAQKVSMSSLLPVGQESLDKGKQLYSTHCKSCHLDISLFDKGNVTVSEIRTAITTKQLMKYLSFLTDAELGYIQAALRDPNRTRQIAEKCDGVSLPPRKTVLRRLNIREFRNSIRALFKDSKLDPRSYPQPAIASRYDTDDSLRTFESDIEPLVATAEDVIRQLKVNAKFPALACANQTGSALLACTRNLIDPIARMAFRGKLTATELSSLRALVTGVNPAEELETALVSILLSPKFLFHYVNYAENKAGNVHRLSSFEVASRLSFFIWSSIPDDQLLGLAANGELAKPAVLKAQVRRMLADARAYELNWEFSKQWLQVSRFEAANLPGRFPELSASVMSAAMQEPSRLFSAIAQSSQPIGNVLTANYSYLNKTLADYYGAPYTATNTTDFVAIQFAPSTGRGGLMTQLGILAQVTTTAETSPVRRGYFIMQNFMCEPPESPPLGATDGSSSPGPSGTGSTARDLLQVHRTNPTCFGCHKDMDPIGLSLETFSALGKFRTTYSNNVPIDLAGVLSDGTRFADSRSMAAGLVKGGRFQACLTQHFSAYALGRILDQGENCAAKRTTASLPNAGAATFADLVENFVSSDLFLMSGLD